MNSNQAWLVAIVAVVALAAWRFTPARPSVSPTPAVTASPGVAPDLASDGGLLRSDPGYAEVVLLKNPHPGQVLKGEQLFERNCASCHGPTGLGDGPAAMSLNPKPHDLKDVKQYSHGAGDLGVFRTAKYGIDGTGMAPWKGRMTDEETWQVTNYVRSLQTLR